MSAIDVTERIAELLEEAGLYVAVSRDRNTISLAGEVDSEENRQAALDLAQSVAGSAGLTVVDDMEILDMVPDDVFVENDPDTIPRPTDYQFADPESNPEAGHDPPTGLEPDFAGDVGTTDATLATEEGVTYFPPTDPVVWPSDDPGGLDVGGGLEPTATDDLDVSGPGPRRNDEDIADDVRRALLEDALTTDLDVTVAVVRGVVILRGVVPTVDDAENAEAVAARAAGVREIREELQIEFDGG